MFWAEIWKISEFLYLKIFIFGDNIFSIFEYTRFRNEKVTKGYHCNTLSKVMGYTLILTVSLLEWVDVGLFLWALILYPSYTLGRTVRKPCIPCEAGICLKASYALTYLCLASHKRDIGKQCGPRSDAAKRGVWSRSTLFVLITGLSIKHGNNNKKKPT